MINMSKHSFISAILLIVIGALISYLFSVEYPCTLSGVGCLDMWQMLHDTWANLVGIVLMIVGVLWALSSLFPVEKKDE